jgi:demethylmenaquinone methyltransferase/2-methoxy-6-polyprenyl-1,4-benzoquinol methylase
VFSYVFMKILEGRPRSYDRRMDAVSRGRVRAIKEAVAGEVLEGSRVLEIGCGTGELASLLVLRGCTVDGFDASPSMVEAARERMEAEGIGERFTVREMGVEAMDGLPESGYDAVVSTLVFSELTGDERRFALKHARRAIRPGGLLVVADEVRPRAAGGRALQALLRAPAAALTYLVSGGTTRPIDDLAGEIAGAGFSIKKEARSHGDAFAVVVASREDAGEAP